MDYKTLIMNWHKKAKEQDDIFSKFVFEYLAFIAFIKTQLNYMHSSNDRPFLQKFKSEQKIKKAYLKTIQENVVLRNDWQIIMDELSKSRLGTYSRNPFEVQEISWWNCSHEQLNEKTLEENNKDGGVLYGFDDWENMVEFWYSIRNNLFHGTKDPNAERDQLLIDYGYKTLTCLMQLLLVNQNNELIDQAAEQWANLVIQHAAYNRNNNKNSKIIIKKSNNLRGKNEE